MSDFIKSTILRRILVSLAALIVLSAVFFAGAIVGAHKERRFASWCEPYGRMLLPHRHGFPGGMFFDQFMHMNAHVVSGKVLSVSGNGFVMQSGDVEQAVLTASSTVIRIGGQTADIKAIQPGMQAAVFGEPNDQGQIQARLVRLLP